MSASLRRHYPDQVRGYDLSPHYRAPLGLPFANRCKDNTFFRTVAFAGKKRKDLHSSTKKASTYSLEEPFIASPRPTA